MPCSCCEMTDRTFGEKDARDSARQYQRHGPSVQTREMLGAIRSLGLKDASLLDIGGGVGVLHHELLQDVGRTATHVDASSAYLREARAEADRLGHSDRVRFIHADFTDIAADLPQADIVTLDRVVCCYPDFRALLSAAAGRSRRVLALTYPRETWYLRIFMKLINLLQGLRREPFRVFLHPVTQMDALLASEGLHRFALKRFFVWEAASYRR